jgi:hypothetical protein
MTSPVTEANLLRLNAATGTAANVNAGAPAKATSSEGTRRSSMSLTQRASEQMQTMLLRSMLAVHDEPARLPIEARKEPLALSTTALNFRGFVQKSGPLFTLQDGVVATLMWDDWAWTSLFMALWAVLGTCVYRLADTSAEATPFFLCTASDSCPDHV